jgi:indole-3-glycerol phosphate synthase
VTSTLHKIVSETRERIGAGVSAARRASLEKMAAEHRPRGFRSALLAASETGPAVIAELKKASPSKGLIREQFNVRELATELQSAGAAALSVLTEENYFQGSLENLRLASESASVPCLRKDFVVDELQMLEARAYRADAVLLIVAALSDRELSHLRSVALSFELDVLCEVHDENELERAAGLGFDIVGVNNRDLRSLEVSLSTSERLSARMPSAALRVAESGIHSGEDIARLQACGFEAFLIGESLMKQPQPGEALRQLLTAAASSRTEAVRR